MFSKNKFSFAAVNVLAFIVATNKREYSQLANVLKIDTIFAIVRNCQTYVSYL